MFPDMLDLLLTSLEKLFWPYNLFISSLLSDNLHNFHTKHSYLILGRLPLFHSSLNKELAAVCIETMKTNSTLTRLELCECDIDDASAALAEQLKENSTLQELDFDNCAISKVAADALGKGLKENSTLTVLDLSNNGICDVGANALAKGLKDNSKL